MILATSFFAVFFVVASTLLAAWCLVAASSWQLASLGGASFFQVCVLSCSGWSSSRPLGRRRASRGSSPRPSLLFEIAPPPSSQHTAASSSFDASLVAWLLCSGDGPSAFQLAKQEQIETRGPPTFAIDASDVFDFSMLAACDFNSATLREQVEDALFGA